MEVKQTLMKNRKEIHMFENENLAMETIAENVEPTTEEMVEVVEQIETPEKTYTQEEVNQIVGRRIARNEAKIRKEYDRKYGELENVLKAGTGKDDVTELTDEFRSFYESKGVQIPKEPTYSAKDLEVLARAEADDIINSGYEEVVEEVDRLAGVGFDNMNAREKALFKKLAEYRQNAERGRELSKLGVTEEVYNSKDFKDFAAKFSSDTSVTEIYEIYNKTQPKKEFRVPGSMKSEASDDTGVKDFYTRDEALKFTTKDFDKNPELFKAVEKSMHKW